MDNTLLIFRPKVLFSKALADLKDWFHQFHQYYSNVFYAKSLKDYVLQALYTEYYVNNLFMVQKIFSVWNPCCNNITVMYFTFYAKIILFEKLCLTHTTVIFSFLSMKNHFCADSFLSPILQERISYFMKIPLPPNLLFYQHYSNSFFIL